MLQLQLEYGDDVHSRLEPTVHTTRSAQTLFECTRSVVCCCGAHFLLHTVWIGKFRCAAPMHHLNGRAHHWCAQWYCLALLTQKWKLSKDTCTRRGYRMRADTADRLSLAQYHLRCTVLRYFLLLDIT